MSVTTIKQKTSHFQKKMATTDVAYFTKTYYYRLNTST